MSKHIEILIEKNPLSSAMEDVARVWEAGKPADPINRLIFDSLDTMLKSLTPKRFELMKSLHSYADGLTIKALSDLLKRDYKNVHVDVTALVEIGLLERDPITGAVLAPYDSIHARFDLAA